MVKLQYSSSVVSWKAPVSTGARSSRKRSSGKPVRNSDSWQASPATDVCTTCLLLLSDPPWRVCRQGVPISGTWRWRRDGIGRIRKTNRHWDKKAQPCCPLTRGTSRKGTIRRDSSTMDTIRRSDENLSSFTAKDECSYFGSCKMYVIDPKLTFDPYLTEI